jgi:hypothetical protein
MKKLALKSAILIPALIFSIFLIMTIIGCASCIFGLDHNYFSCTYCTIFKSLTLIAIVMYFTVTILDIKMILKK